MEKTAKIISYIFHPLLVPSLGVLILFNSGTYLSYLPPELKRWIFGFTFVSTCLIPLAAVYFMYYQGVVRNLQLSSREERLAPLTISLIMYVFCFYLVQRIDIPRLYDAFLMSGVAAIAASLLVTMKYKISIHMVGMGGLIALIGFLAFHLRVDLHFYLIFAVLLAGIVGSARLIVKAHNEAETYSGFFLGFTAVIITMLFF